MCARLGCVCATGGPPLPPLSPTHLREPADEQQLPSAQLENHLQDTMKQLVWLSILLCLFVCHLSDARVIPEGVPYDEPAAAPYWPFSTSDFWNYIEYFRSIGAYDRINNMARTFYAHQPIADTLGYETNEGHEH